MTFQDLANLGDAIGGLGVIISLLYLAVQIRQNTRAVRSSSYHQAAEQMWNYCLAIAQDGSLAEVIAKRIAGQSLTPAEQIRLNVSNQALIFGFENMLRLQEEGMIDPDVWRNFFDNSVPDLKNDYVKDFLRVRTGPLSQRLLAAIDASPVPARTN
jgi:hypothetical protein